MHGAKVDSRPWTRFSRMRSAKSVPASRGAQSWADALGLAAEPAVHHGWEKNAGAVLVGSADPRLNALLSTRFRHTREHDQLDLFIDSAQTVAVNALLDVLIARNAGKARQALERLVRIDRDHGQRFHAPKLIAALDAPVPEGSERGLDRLERMEREWAPAAAALLGVRRRDFLAPLWRDIARALGPAPFDPSRPERHATRAYREGLDWGHLKQSVLAVPDYATEPVLLARLAEAHWRLHDRANAIDSWFALCPLAPEVFERVIEAADFPDWALRTAWRVALEQDFEPEMTPRVVSRLDAARRARTRGRTRAAPRRTDDDPSRAFDAQCRCWPIRVWIDTQLNSAVRSRPSTRVCWSDFWRSGRGPPRLCRYRGRHHGLTSRRQESACIRRNSTSSRPARRPTLELPPLLRSELPRIDANPVRFDDGLSRADCARGHFGSPPPNWVSGPWLA